MSCHFAAQFIQLIKRKKSHPTFSLNGALISRFDDMPHHGDLMTCHSDDFLLQWLLALMTCRFNNFWHWWLATLMTCRFNNFLLQWLAALMTCCFDDLPLAWLAASMSSRFNDLLLWSLAALMTCHFDDLPFDDLPLWWFAALMICHYNDFSLQWLATLMTPSVCPCGHVDECDYLPNIYSQNFTLYKLDGLATQNSLGTLPISISCLFATKVLNAIKSFGM